MKFLKQIRKRKLLTFGFSFVFVAALSMTPVMNEISSAGMNAGRNLMALLGARSPGERPDGVLLETKLRKAPRLAANEPRQYAEPKVRERLPVGPLGAPGPVPGPTAVPLAQIGDVPGPGIYYPGPSSVGGPPGPVIGVPPGGGGTVVPPGGGTVTPPGGGGVINPPSPPTPTSAVPEPAVWLNMLVGFGAVAMLLRFRRRKAKSSDRMVPAPATVRKGVSGRKG